MWSLIASTASSASGLLVLLAVCAGLMGAGAFGQNKIDAAKLQGVELSYTQAQAKAVAQAAATQKSIDDQALVAQQTETLRQAALAADVQKELADVPNHVSKTVVPCIPYGLVRLLDAAILGVDASSLALPAGKSDASCSPLTVDDLARTTVSNYGNARSNAEQLNALIALLKGSPIVEKK